MNKEQMLDELHKKYARKDLEFGCKCIWEGTLLIFTGKYGKPSMDGNDELVFLRGGICQTFKKDKIEIIGHELLLTDILKAMGENLGQKYCIEADGECSYLHDYIRGWSGLKFDLSKPYFKDQSIEIITAIYNLIK